MFGWSLSAFSLPDTPPGKITTIVIDAGHGGKDPGTMGTFTKEKDIAFNIAIQLGNLIRTHYPDINVVQTRYDKDKFVSLYDRAKIANRLNADLFISIHCNASSNSKAQGTETYIMGLGASEDNMEVAKRENSVIFQERNYQKVYGGFDPNSPMTHILLANYQHAYQESSLLMAEKIEEQFASKQHRISRGVKQNTFIVLAKTSMPSVLVEVGFLSNEEDEAYLSSDLGQGYTVAALYRAFRDYKKSIEENLE
ncbi:N-acetylmuramoyl-L-alanine amidase [Rapidithrix thailandica]|uniref:N-acetylmuramoyl-L-alanine amidase n=1 Tax=Rapidithrix thailandica TaxID=413964 RepID=A0AAW9RZL1_9BACT